MDVQQEDNGKKGKFFVLENGQQEAEMTYTWAGDSRIIIDHTDVGEALKGKSAGKQMVMQAVAFAREKGIKIIPLCPFAKSVFDKVAEIRDVL
ncbi:GNAT family N-acetyltransferase [Eisenibacter elegans]|uniref:GNAT family N-acetyltransferase n=1 Tax=Eisenibacter elegans TaxID=997 RepID=UPI0003F820B6|nr:GNAT family N-acetyltransferase [Eisenibacter elegans]